MRFTKTGRPALSLASIIAVLAALILTACGGSNGGGNEVAKADTTSLAMTAIDPLTTCTALATHDFSTVAGAPATVSSATVSGANCVVTGTINATQKFVVQLPTKGWTQRFMMSGCGGYCGSVGDPRTGNGTQAFGCKLLEQNGMVLATSDLGHQATIAGGAWAKNNPAAVIDFAYLGMHKMTVLSKAMIEAYYGQPPKRSYYIGCSDGGREGLQEAQRYPEDYDGIVVGSPVIDETSTNTFYHSWHIRSNSGANGLSILTTDKMATLAAAVKATCGDEGGLIQDPRSCDGEKILASVSCSGADSAACLTSAQADVVRKYWSGPVDENGVHLFPGDLPIGSELSWSSVTAAGTRSDSGGEGVFAADFPNYMSNWGSGTGITYENISFSAAGYNALTTLSTLWDPTNPDLSKFAARGGKLIIWHGWADSGSSPLGSLNYWTAVRKQMGTDAASKFMSLYLLAGVGHCNSGVNTTRTDFLTPVIDWVENGVAPNKVTVNFVSPSQTSSIVSSRPSYPYPSTVKYNGKGNLANEESWVRADVSPTVSDTTAWAGLGNYIPGKQMSCDVIAGSSIPRCSLK
jgi:hypothetical protein